MECVVNNKPSVVQAEASAEKAVIASHLAAAAPAANATDSSSAAATASSSATATAAGKKKKAATPSAIARERKLEREKRESATADIQQSLMRKVQSGTVKDMQAAKDMLKHLMTETEKAANSAAASSSSSGPLAKKGKGKGKGTGNPQSIFTAGRRSADQTGKQHLLDEHEEWFLPKAESALEEIFRRFDSTHAGQATADFDSMERTPKDALCWTTVDIQAFARATNGQEFSTEELLEIKENLTHDDQGRLTCTGFCDFYHLQTTSHPDETWKDLKRLSDTRDTQGPDSEGSGRWIECSHLFASVALCGFFSAPGDTTITWSSRRLRCRRCSLDCSTYREELVPLNLT